jgi:c-di-GMP-binding flagellar brake protein YcgR
VRVTYQDGTIGRLLKRLNLFPFRCQVCATRFHVFRPGLRNASHIFDRRQYKRLATNFPAISISGKPLAESVVTDLSMNGCSIGTSSSLAQGSFLELHLKPLQTQKPIKVETAMVCSVHPPSIGVKFLEVSADDKRRLSQVIFSLLIRQSASPTA